MSSTSTVAVAVQTHNLNRPDDANDGGDPSNVTPQFRALWGGSVTTLSFAFCYDGMALPLADSVSTGTGEFCYRLVDEVRVMLWSADENRVDPCRR